MNHEPTPDEAPPTTYSPALSPPAVMSGAGDVPPAQSGAVADMTATAPAHRYVPATNGQVPYLASRPTPLTSEWFALRRARARKVRRTIRHIDPWSVFKVSVLLYFCLYVAVLISGVLLWSAAVGSGLIANVESFIEELLTFESYEFQADEIFRGFAIIGLVLAAAGAAFNVVMAILFNLISDLTGGVRITVLEEDDAVPLARQTPKPARRPRPKAAARPSKKRPASAPRPPIPDQSTAPPVASPEPPPEPVRSPPVPDHVVNQSPVS